MMMIVIIFKTKNKNLNSYQNILKWYVYKNVVQISNENDEGCLMQYWLKVIFCSNLFRWKNKLKLIKENFQVGEPTKLMIAMVNNYVDISTQTLPPPFSSSYCF